MRQNIASAMASVIFRRDGITGNPAQFLFLGQAYREGWLEARFPIELLDRTVSENGCEIADCADALSKVPECDRARPQVMVEAIIAHKDGRVGARELAAGLLATCRGDD